MAEADQPEYPVRSAAARRPADEAPRAPAGDLLQRLSLADKAQLTSGSDMWCTRALESIGLRQVRFSDGSNGVRGPRFDERDHALCTPCGSALGASWDPQLVETVGRLVGEEARRRGVHGVLGPTLNLHRTPLGGRAFECLSEDPVLAGTLGAQWVRGVQSVGVAACPKHFVANDTETGRTRVDCVIDDRALREIYLLPFEHALKAGAWTLMAAYNRVNGVHCAEHAALLSGVVKGDWAWDGLIMSDWFATHDTLGSANGGLDLEMPGPGRVFGARVADAVKAGAIDAAVLDDKVRRLLRLAGRVGRLGPVALPTEPGEPTDGIEILRASAAAGFVLLKNDADLLPLRPGRAQRIAVIGPNATRPLFQGTGTAWVAMAPSPDPLSGIRARYGATATVTHQRGSVASSPPDPLQRHEVRATHRPDYAGLTVEYFSSENASGTPVARELRNNSNLIWYEGIPQLADARRAYVRVSTWLTPADDGAHTFFLRASDRARLSVNGREIATLTAPHAQDFLAALFSDAEAQAEVELEAGVPARIEFDLRCDPAGFQLLSVGCRPPAPKGLLERAVAEAAAADAVILIVGTTEEQEGESLDRATTTLPGDQDELVQRIVSTNPATVVVVNAGYAVDMPWADEARAILYAWLPGQEFGTALAETLSGDREPGGRLPITIARTMTDYPALATAPDRDGKRQYSESTLMGYRHFDTYRVRPAFCFGHGLTYTTFRVDAMTLSTRRLRPNQSLSVYVTVRNTGPRTGKEVVQLYLAADGDTGYPPMQLKAFTAVTLEPSESQTVTLELGPRAFARWSPERGAWHIATDTFDVHVGRSSRDIRLSARVNVIRDSATTQWATA